MKTKDFNTTNSGQIIKFSTFNTLPNTQTYLSIILEKNHLNLSVEEVDEFCELLQEKKKEIWKS